MLFWILTALLCNQAFLSPFTRKIENTEDEDPAGDLEDEDFDADEQVPNDDEDGGDHEIDLDAAAANEEDIDEIIKEVQREHALTEEERAEGRCAVTKVCLIPFSLFHSITTPCSL